MVPGHPNSHDSCALNPGREIETLYREHQPWLRNWLRGKLGCPADASDLSQDSFLRLLTVDLSLLQEPRAYLLVIANRLMINRHRRRQLEADVLRQVAHTVETQNQQGPAEIVAARDLLHQVLMMLTEELPDKPRKAFLWARTEGMSYREIAERLDVSQSSVKQYIARALVHCHARLYDDFRDHGQ
ncbi:MULTISPECIES: sigma-70 family RNA polymerase sigma factor [Marinobacter]|uniref:Sigma-70 family RNA polymerase sigma factor n=1 Tax=Marinobacter xestospongiae TaxID=994319 RepID=A0ABU3VVP6_9GAMM|nr:MULTISPECIES: sigma-70 family RNA polymerase sigma factor [Marinobacter]MCK7567796.1 sigma-70 family RNA polymerase sigma factor [Marinobacter xestospongiae]MDV2078353.1 sigma-70 family RNA polymerase sigma factor [Marinobacter xestospongiae]UDL05402.1 sigma-70 family RNA polymerase sigma factor [Marinobacter sp. CA1]